MLRFFWVPGVLLIVTLGITPAAPVPHQHADVIKDRTGFIPNRKYFSLPGKVIGVLAGDVVAMMGQEGRSGPPQAYGFSAAGGSYRWVYTPAKDRSIIQNLQVRVGPNGDRIQVYPALNMADPNTIKQFRIEAPYALVEVEVNGGLGAPADEAFVATAMTRLDATKAYPFSLPEVVAEAKKRYERHLQDQKHKIEEALQAAAAAHLRDKTLSGPRQTSQLFYLTWLPEIERVRLHFRTQVTDGALQNGRGIEPLDQPVPLPRGGGRGGRGGSGPMAFRPPPALRPIGGAFGSLVGVELGLALEVSKNGKVDRVLTLPIESFHRVLPPPPGGRKPVDPLPPVRRF